MGRVFFPTYRSNILGVRDVGRQTGLQGLGNQIVIPRAPAEPYPRAANNPTHRMLGAAVMETPAYSRLRAPYDPILVYHPPQTPTATTTQTPGAPLTTPAQPAPPVSAQNSPTPVVTVPAQPNTGAVAVSSGGGTAIMATAPATPIIYTTDAYGNIINAATGAVVMSASLAQATGNSAAGMTAAASPTTAAAAAPTDITDQVTAWLSGSTVMFGYSVPNPVLVLAGVLGFALLSNMGGKKR